MKAMILAAGMGSRLRPLTDNRPKALVEVAGRSMLDIVIQRLASEGFNEIIINVHHFAGQIISHVEAMSLPGVTLKISDESAQLLETGGAIMKARWFLEEGGPFLVHNVDVVSDVDLHGVMAVHRERGSLATLAVSQRQSSRYFLFDSTYRLWGWENLSREEKVISMGAPADLIRMAFSGIHILSPDIFQHMDETGRFSIIPVYLKLADSFPIHGYQHNPESWFDLGRIEDIKRAEEIL